MNRNFEDRKSRKSCIQNIEDKQIKAIIKALDMYGRVPEQWELLEEIEKLNNIINNTTVELEILLQSEDFELITMQLRNIVFRLKGSE